MTGHRLTLSLSAFVLLTMIGTPLFGGGAEIYKTKCFACHGEKGKGDTTMGRKLGVRDLASAAVQAQDDASLTAVIAGGRKKMPAYSGKVSDADIKLLVALIRTFAAK